MKRCLTAILAMVIIFTLSLAGCGSSKSTDSTSTTAAGSTAAIAQTTVSQAQTTQQSAPVALRYSWWGGQERADSTIKLIDQYTQKYPNVKITPEYTSWDEYWNKMSVEAAGGGLADIMQMDESYIGQYGDKNLLIDMTPYTKDGTLDLNDANQKLLQVGVYNSKLIAVSIASNALTVIYDPALFQKAGITVPQDNWTWQDFEKTALDLHKALGKTYGANAVWASQELFRDYVESNGQDFLNQDGTALTYDDKMFVDFLNMSLRLRKAEACVSPEENAGIAGIEDDPIVHGTAAMNIGGHSNEVVAYTDAAKRPLGLLLLPTGTKEVRASKNSMFMSVTSTSKIPADAARFMNYFINDLDANKILMAERGLPISSKVRDGLIPFLGDPQKVSFDFTNKVESLGAPVESMMPPNYGTLQDNWQKVTDEVMYGKSTPEQGAAKFKSQANEIMAKNKK